MMYDNATTAPHGGKGFWHVPLDIAVARDPELSPNDKAVYGVICTHADVKTRFATLAVATVATEAGCSKRTVQNCVKKLVEHGVLAREERFADEGRQ